AEAVLDRTEHAKRVAAVALEVKNRIDHVLEHSRSREVAFLGHVADEEAGGAGLLAERDQAPRRLAHLADRAGGGRELRAGHRLDRVDGDDLRVGAPRGLEDALERGLAEDPRRGAPEPEAIGSHADLL